MITPPPSREALSRTLRIAACSADPELAADAAAALRRLNKAPTMPRRARCVATVKHPFPRPVAPVRKP